MEKSFIRVKDRLINIKEVHCVFMQFMSEIVFEFKNGDIHTIEYDTPEERDIEFGIIERTLADYML